VAIAGENPIRFFVVLVTVSALAYIPLALAYSPFAWANFGPISFQISRPLLYVVYFLVGFAIGARGFDRGLLACDGALARRWAAWLAMAVLGFALWAAPTSMTMDDWSNSPFLIKFAAGLGFVVACASGCLSLLAICLRFGHMRWRALNSLSANAYGMYLVHYGIAIALQYALLDVELFAIGKAAIVFGCTVVTSWAAAAVLGGMPLVSRLKPEKRRLSGA